MKTVSEIIIDYLKEIGADGLCNQDWECGCGIDDGLFPCDTCNAECYPAKHAYCILCDINDECDYRKTTNATECYREHEGVKRGDK